VFKAQDWKEMVKLKQITKGASLNYHVGSKCTFNFRIIVRGIA
jgi:hypothetical protein